MVKLDPTVADSTGDDAKKLAFDCASRTQKEARILQLWYNPDISVQSKQVEYPEIMNLFA